MRRIDRRRRERLRRRVVSVGVSFALGALVATLLIDRLQRQVNSRSIGPLPIATTGAGSGSAAVTAADGHLYFRYQNGTMALIEANPKEYILKSTFEIPNVQHPSWSHPVVTAGRLYLREQGELHVYNVRK